jgi:hypothetical protein
MRFIIGLRAKPALSLFAAIKSEFNLPQKGAKNAKRAED